MPKDLKPIVKEELKALAEKRSAVWEVRELEEYLRKKGISIGERTLYKCLDSLWKKDLSIHKTTIPTNVSHAAALGFNDGLHNEENLIKNRKNILWCYYYDNKDTTPWQEEEVKELLKFDKALLNTKEQFERCDPFVRRELISNLKKNQKAYLKSRRECYQKDRAVKHCAHWDSQR